MTALPDPSILCENSRENGLNLQSHPLLSVLYTSSPMIYSCVLERVFSLHGQVDTPPATSTQQSQLVAGISLYSSGEVLPPSEIGNHHAGYQPLLLGSGLWVLHDSDTVVKGVPPTDQSPRTESRRSSTLQLNLSSLRSSG